MLNYHWCCCVAQYKTASNFKGRLFSNSRGHCWVFNTQKNKNVSDYNVIVLLLVKKTQKLHCISPDYSTVVTFWLRYQKVNDSATTEGGFRTHLAPFTQLDFQRETSYHWWDRAPKPRPYPAPRCRPAWGWRRASDLPVQRQPVRAARLTSRSDRVSTEGRNPGSPH